MKTIFGAMNIGEPGDGRTRVHTLQEAQEMLTTFQTYNHKDIDTARVYGNGSSEKFLAQMHLESGINIDTKLFPTAVNSALASADELYHHSPIDLRRGLQASLDALNVEQVHIWYLHSPDRTIPFETTLREVNALYKEGLFEKWGLSNYQSWEVSRICEICERNGWVKPSVCQGIYNAFHRAVEPELLTCLRVYGIAFYCFNPLAAGILTGRYTREQLGAKKEGGGGGDQTTGGRFDVATGPGRHIRKRYYHDVYFDAVEGLRRVMRGYGLTEVECALRWLKHHSRLEEELGDGIVIGCSNGQQLEENLKALEGGPLPEEVVDALDKGWEGIRGKELVYWH
ncbi:NADP-dependent oxidoreductase domain-containing protein [Aspergillus cavernicola]|uniref:NADP-dependent oxidoreductase domain-containing protein n=1 Tax=Aspergillus cavernicola TaxID=176166 RepID=A0ABR4IZS3_9EURO